MKKVRPFTLLAAAAAPLAVLATVGCGDSRPPTYPVTGTVSYQGDPVERAHVSFSPTEADIRAATGVTDSDGKYTLTTFEQDDGAMPGSYKVRVHKYDREPEPTEVTEVTDDIDVPLDYDPDEGADIPPPQHVLPEEYRSSSKTPLSFTVEASDEGNVYDIDLE